MGNKLQEKNMADQLEPEMIRREMQLRRAAISEKLEALEHRVLDTMQDARNAVTDTVKQTKEAVAETVQTVKDSVHASVETVKETLDIPRQVERNPWTMIGGAVAVGFFAGCLLNRAAVNRSGAEPPAYAPATPIPGAPASGLAGAAGHSVLSAPIKAPTRHEESWATQASRTFAPEIQKLKGMAVGVLVGVVRDMVKESVPDALRPQVGEMMDNIATKMGGEAVQSDVLEQLFPPRHGAHPNGHPRAAQEEFHG
jgi:ElaB/YqjD/DUF883 family membrane-anchored ribosome-binding protein